MVVATWAAVWLAWSVTRFALTPSGLAFAGIALPALVLLVIAGLRSAFRAPTRAPVRPPVAPPAAAERRAHGNSIALLGASLCLPAGDTPNAVSAAARRGTMPKLHSTLVRSDASPVHACEVPSLSPADFPPASLDAEAIARLDIAHRRALLLSANVLEKLFARSEKTGDPDAKASPSASEKSPITAELHLLLPKRWQDEASTLAAWLQAQFSHASRSIHFTELHLHLLSTSQDALGVMDSVNTAINESNSRVQHVVLACDSRLAQADVSELERTGALHGHGRPEGKIPAEGACALLVASPGYDAGKPDGDGTPPPHLHRLLKTETPCEGQSDRSATTSVEDNASLAALLDQAHNASVPAGTRPNPCALVSDAGSTSQPRLDLTSAAESAWPDQSAPVRLDHLGLANGDSAALTLSTIAVAGALAVQTQRPALAISVATGGSYAIVPVSFPVASATSISESREMAKVAA